MGNASVTLEGDDSTDYRHEVTHDSDVDPGRGDNVDGHANERPHGEAQPGADDTEQQRTK
jgi:hypothetical protein